MTRVRLWLVLWLGIWGPVGTASAAEYWELQSSDVSVMTEGRKPTAAAAATMILRLRRAARWMASWPADYQPAPVLAIGLDDRTLDRFFQRPSPPDAREPGPASDHGFAISLPQLTIVVYTLSKRRGGQFEQMQFLYGRALLNGAPTAAWPDCVRGGLGIILSSADLRNEHRLYVPADSVAFRVWYDMPPLPPREFINPADARQVSEAMRDRRAYSCHALAMMALHDEPLPRAAFARYFGLLGEGTDAAAAASTAFGLSEGEFAQALSEFAHAMRWRPATQDLLVELGGGDPQWPEAKAVSPERMASVLSQLATKLGTPADGAR